jgi:hypothetical protein
MHTYKIPLQVFFLRDLPKVSNSLESTLAKKGEGVGATKAKAGRQHRPRLLFVPRCWLTC